MSYRLNRTDGQLLVDLTDGILDNTTTDITLIGKNYKGFGEFLNENFIKLMENFASTSQPANPMVGQLWFDKQDNRLKVYDGETFRPATGSVVSSSQPSNLNIGDIWIDNLENKLYIWDGTDLTLIGPEYSAAQGKTGFEVASQLDTTDVQRTILKLFLGDTLVGIYSPAEFIVPTEYAIPGFPVWAEDTFFPKRQYLKEGFNPVSTNFKWNGVAASALGLVDDAGVTKTAANFLPTDDNGETTGSIRIKNSAGLSIGVGDTEYLIAKIVGTTATLETQQSDRDFAIRVRSGNSFKPAIYVDTSQDYLGMWKTNPAQALDVNGNANVDGDVTIGGNLTVQGDSTFLNTTTLRVEDKNIELALLDDSTEGNDTQVDGAGIIVRSTQGSKDFTWSQATASWTSNQDIDIRSNPTNSEANLRIEGTGVLTKTTLGTTVTSALGLTRVGTLSELTVDDITLNGATISRINGTGLNVVAGGDISIDSQKITSVADPTDAQDVATKAYVDAEVANETRTITMDITGLTDPSPIASYDGVTNFGPQDSVKNLLTNLLDPTTLENGTTCFVLATTYSGSTVSGINVSIDTTGTGVLEKSFVSVTDAAGTGTESVIQDVSAANTASGAVSLVATRYIYEYQTAGGVWVFQTATQQTVT
jgi:hypothetical protein